MALWKGFLFFFFRKPPYSFKAGLLNLNTLTSFKKTHLYWLCLCIHLGSVEPRRPEEGRELPGVTSHTVGRECWDLNSAPLQKQQLLPTDCGRHCIAYHDPCSSLCFFVLFVSVPLTASDLVKLQNRVEESYFALFKQE